MTRVRGFTTRLMWQKVFLLLVGFPRHEPIFLAALAALGLPWLLTGGGSPFYEVISQKIFFFHE